MPRVGRSGLLGLAVALALADSSVVTLALPDIVSRFGVSITARHHQDHYGAQRVEQEAPVDGEGRELAACCVERKAGDPGELDQLMDAMLLPGKLPDCAHAEDETEQHHAGADQLDQGAGRRSVMMSVVVPVIMAMIVPVRVIMRMIVIVMHVLHALGNRCRGRRLRVEYLAKQQHQGRSAEREQRDQPDEI